VRTSRTFSLGQTTTIRRARSLGRYRVSLHVSGVITMASDLSWKISRLDSLHQRAWFYSDGNRRRVECAV